MSILSYLTPPKGELTEVLAQFKSAFWAVAAFSLAVNVLLLVPAVYMLQISDRVLTSGNGVTLLMLTLIMLGLFVLESTLEFTRGQVMVKAGVALDTRLDGRLFDAAFAHGLSGKGTHAGAALADLSVVRQFLTGKSLFAFFDMPWTPIYLAVIFLLHPWLGLFSLIATVLLLALAVATERSAGPMLDSSNNMLTKANQLAASSMRNAEVIRAMGMLTALRERWLVQQNHYLITQSQASSRFALIGGISRLCRLALQSGILGVGAWLVINGQLSAGGMMAASILLGRALSPVDLAIASWRGVVAARAAYGRTAQLLEANPARAKATSLPRPAGQVAAENLFISSPNSRMPILKNINFRVAPGTIIAVIGASASGKSTLARALVGVWSPLSGAVRLDGACVHDWNPAELGPWIGYLPQDVELFEGTVAQNIARFGALDSTQIVKAARKAGVHELILHLPQGYETPLGEGGATLSGGQRQRIALARALYGDPALIVLDEPNASLDEAGEAALSAALHTLKEETCTVFVITHRASLLNASDAIMVMSEGAIQAFGPRDALLKAPERKGGIAPFALAGGVA